MATTRRAQILSVGTCVPENFMLNKDFEKFLDTTDEWITARTGIRKRHIVPRDEHLPASELGSNAARVALEKAGVSAESIDGIICATFTPDSFFPSTACRIQALLGCKNAFAFDMSAACAGFVYALSTGNALIASGQANTILVIGAEVISKTLDWTDRTTCILFGDGAGAVVLKATEDESLGVLSTYMSSDGTLGDILVLPAWGEKRTMSMKGNEVFKHAVRMMAEASKRALDMAGMALSDIDIFVPHQANIRIVQSVAEHLGLPESKVIANLDRYGNTSSASIPLALEDAWVDGRVRKGTQALFTALGGGIAVASAVVRF